MSSRVCFGPLPGRSLITARWIVGHRNGRHCLLPEGELVFEGPRIIFVGHGFPGPVERRLDFGNAIVGPGFIDLDALADLDTTILAFDNQPEHRTGRVWPRTYLEAGPYEMYDREELAFQKRYAFARLLRGGITTAAPIASLFYRAWAETVEEFEDAAIAAADLGIRVYLGPAFSSGTAVVENDGRITMHFDEVRGLEGLRDAGLFAARMEGAHGGLVRGMLAPNRIETCTPGLLDNLRAVAKELDCPVRLHACQSAFEYETVMIERGEGPIEWLDRHELLTPRLLIPHLTHVAPSARVKHSFDDLALLVDRGVSLVHCPLVAARYGDAINHFARYRALGLNVAMGTDTAPPDMIRNMQVALLIGRVLAQDAQAVRAEDLYDAATLGGARALMRDDLGRLEAGALADFTVFDLSCPELGQVIDPVQTIMIAGSSHGFTHVAVNGEFRMIGKKVKEFDEVAGAARAQHQFDRLVSRYPDRTWRHPPVEDTFSSSYPAEPVPVTQDEPHGG